MRVILWLTCLLSLTYGQFDRVYYKGVDYVKYIIIGAGPSGMQTAAFLKHKGYHTLILEQGPSVGTFFRMFPRHGMLISINKRYTGRDNATFNERHDWNSILAPKGVEGSPVFGDFSDKFWPTQDEYVAYLEAYAKFHQLEFEFNQKVTKISLSNPNSNRQGRYVVKAKSGKRWLTDFIFVCTSLTKPNIPKMKGIEHAVGYEAPEFVVDPKYYTNKRVLVLGLGNSAFEILKSMADTAAYVHLLGRSHGGLRQAYNTHYPGDLRAINAHATDTFLLKSMDTIDVGFDVTNAELIKNETDGTIRLHHGVTNNYNYRDPYDVVIRALGWKFDNTIFHKNIRPAYHYSGKYPESTITYELDYNPKEQSNIYFAGTLAHSKDFRVSAGGFIHGFRYTARAMMKLHLFRVYGEPMFDLEIRPAGPTTIARALIERIQVSAGLYQMFAELCDVLTWSKDYEDGLTADYIFEIPCKYADIGYQPAGMPVFTLHFDYGHGLNGRADNSVATLHPGRAHMSQFLHPIIRYYMSGEKPDNEGPKPLQLLAEFHLLEDFLVSWNVDKIHFEPLEAFVTRVLSGDFTTQHEMWERQRDMHYANLTAEQRRTGHTVMDEWYGPFPFPAEQASVHMGKHGGNAMDSMQGMADKGAMGEKAHMDEHIDPKAHMERMEGKM